MKNKRILFTFLLLFISITLAFAQKYNAEKDFKIEIIQNRWVRITDYVGKKKTVSIPPVIKRRRILSSILAQRAITEELPIMEIGAEAFKGKKITSVTFHADNGLIIGFAAFMDNDLTSVSLPVNVTAIGDYAFANNKLCSVSIPNNVTSIGDYAFANNKLTSVSIPDRVTAIGGYAFTNNALTSITLPYHITVIGDKAFYENNLTEIVLPNRIESIGSFAFGGNKITIISIPANVILAQGNETIAKDFNNYYIDNGCMGGIYTYSNGRWTNSEIEMQIIKEQTQYEMQVQKEQELARGFFEIWSGIAGSVMINGQETGQTVDEEGSVTVTVDNAKGVYNLAVKDALGSIVKAVDTITIVNTGPNNIYRAVVLNPRPQPNAPEDFEVIQNIQGGLTITGYKGTRRQAVIPGLLYGQKVTGIYENTFTKKELLSIAIPDSVITIDERHPGLRLITDSSLVSTVGSVGSGFHGIFSDNNLLQIKIGNGIQIIPNYAFARNIQLSKIEIPDTVTGIGKEAFLNCGLSYIKFGKNIKTIGEGAFMDNSLTSITLPASVTIIGNQAFADNQLESVIIPNGVSQIGFQAFKGNPSLSTLVIPQSLAERSNTRGIGADAFSGCNLTRVTLPANMHDSNLNVFNDVSLINFYKSQEKRAGTYVKKGQIWARSLSDL